MVPSVQYYKNEKFRFPYYNIYSTKVRMYKNTEYKVLAACIVLDKILLYNWMAGSCTDARLADVHCMWHGPHPVCSRHIGWEGVVPEVCPGRRL